MIALLESNQTFITIRNPFSNKKKTPVAEVISKEVQQRAQQARGAGAPQQMPQTNKKQLSPPQTV